MTRIYLAAIPQYTRGAPQGTGLQTIDNKLVVSNVPVPSDPPNPLGFSSIQGLAYQALLYELRDSGDTSGNASQVVPNWFGVAIPNNFDISADVYVVLYFHPTPGQAGYNDADYYNKNGASGGTDWKELYAYIDRLGGQMAGAIQSSGAPANQVVIFPFLTSAQYTLLTSEWFNIIHDILQDINNTNVVNNICTRPKKIIVGAISDASVYLNRFLNEASGDPNYNNIVEVWDFDSDIARDANHQPLPPVDPHGKTLRAYWQGAVPSNAVQNATYIQLPGFPAHTWDSFPRGAQLPDETPPLPPRPSNSNPNFGPDTDPSVNLFHHYIRDTMFLDAVFNIKNDNP